MLHYFAVWQMTSGKTAPVKIYHTNGFRVCSSWIHKHAPRRANEQTNERMNAWTNALGPNLIPKVIILAHFFFSSCKMLCLFDKRCWYNRVSRSVSSQTDDNIPFSTYIQLDVLVDWLWNQNTVHADSYTLTEVNVLILYLLLILVVSHFSACHSNWLLHTINSHFSFCVILHTEIQIDLPNPISWNVDNDDDDEMCFFVFHILQINTFCLCTTNNESAIAIHVVVPWNVKYCD